MTNTKIKSLAEAREILLKQLADTDARLLEERRKELTPDKPSVYERAAREQAEKERDALKVEIDAERLKFRLYSEHECPNQPLLDDLERFRQAAESGLKSARAVSRKAAEIETLKSEIAGLKAAQ